MVSAVSNEFSFGITVSTEVPERYTLLAAPASDMAYLPYFGKVTVHPLLAFVVLLHYAAAGPVTVGVSSTAAMATMNSSYQNPLVIVLPLVGAAFLILFLAVCCCSCRRRKVRYARTAVNTSSQYSHNNHPYGLGILPPSRTAGGYAQLDPASEEMLPPYTPRLTSASERLDASPSGYEYGPNSPLPSIWVHSSDAGEESQKLLNTPSPVVSRTGSPSLQIWTPPIPSSPPNVQQHT